MYSGIVYLYIDYIVANILKGNKQRIDIIEKTHISASSQFVSVYCELCTTDFLFFFFYFFFAFLNSTCESAEYENECDVVVKCVYLYRSEESSAPGQK